MSERNTPRKDGELVSYKMGATKIEAGNLVALASGYATHAADTAGHIVVGVAEETVDNSTGSAGDKSVLVRKRKAHKLKNHATNALTQALTGGSAYVADSQTVQTNAATNDIVVGKVLAVETDGVWVQIDG